jgi:hypothetical protein
MLLDEPIGDVFHRLRLVNVSETLEEHPGVLVAQLPEKIQLEDVGLEGVAVLGAADDEDVGVGGR